MMPHVVIQQALCYKINVAKHVFKIILIMFERSLGHVCRKVKFSLLTSFEASSV